MSVLLLSALKGSLTLLSHTERCKTGTAQRVTTCSNASSASRQCLQLSSSHRQKTRLLPLSAFVLAPIQRVARYPLLLQEMATRHAGRPEAEPLRRAHAAFVDITVTCNGRLRALESFDVVRRVERELDRSMLQSPIALSEVNPPPFCSMRTAHKQVSITNWVRSTWLL